MTEDGKTQGFNGIVFSKYMWKGQAKGKQAKLALWYFEQ